MGAFGERISSIYQDLQESREEADAVEHADIETRVGSTWVKITPPSSGLAIWHRTTALTRSGRSANVLPG
jgi:hypothetical protein